MEKGKIPCTAQVLTFNSASTLEHCLQGLLPFNDILILDGGSTDGTLEIAKRFGARVLPQREDGSAGPITDFSSIRNRALSLAKHDWFFYLDDDERIPVRFAEAVAKAIEAGAADAYLVPRQFVLEDGRIIRSGSTYPNYQLRLFRRSMVNPFKKKVHEQVHPKRGTRIAHFPEPMFVPLEPLSDLMRKWSAYLDLQLVGLRPTWERLFSGLRSNSIKFSAYSARMLFVLLFGKHPRMPLGYEWQNALYHGRLMWRMTKYVVREKLKRP